MKNKTNKYICRCCKQLIEIPYQKDRICINCRKTHRYILTNRLLRINNLKKENESLRDLILKIDKVLFKYNVRNEKKFSGKEVINLYVNLRLIIKETAEIKKEFKEKVKKIRKKRKMEGRLN